MAVDQAAGRPTSDVLDRIAISASGVILLLARILIAIIFLMGGFRKLTHLDDTAKYMADHHLPAAFFFAVLAGLVEFFGSLFVLLGFKSRYAALLMALFTLVAAFIGHPFWSVPAEEVRNQTIHFWKDITILGGFLVLFVSGPGALSIDRPK
jgi:putative oxidoreductase